MDGTTVVDENHPLWVITNDGGPKSYETLAATYDKEVKAEEYWGPHSIAQEWRHYHANNVLTSTQKVLDAGCGTGFVGEEMMKLPQASLVQLYGADLSPDMLEQAKAKAIYHDLQAVDLKQPLPYEAEYFDSIVSSGTFLQNHCGPECLPNLARVLKVNGYVVASIRALFWEETRSEWEQIRQECSLELVKLAPIRYANIAKAFVMVYRKTC